MNILQSTPQNISNKVQDIDFEDEKVQILYQNKWYNVCSQEIFIDWLDKVYDLSDCSRLVTVCHDHREQYQTKDKFLDTSEISDRYFNMKEVKRFINRVDPIFLKFELLEVNEEI